MKPTGDARVIFDDKFLDDLRASVRVSEVVSRNPKHKLKRSRGEFTAIDDPRFTVNDKKGLYYDHGSHAEGGDVFQYLVAHCGFTFPQAVDEIAKLAGVSADKPNGKGHRGRANGNAAGIEDHDPRRKRNADAADRKRAVVATYDYHDAQGEVVYQVVRT